MARKPLSIWEKERKPEFEKRLAGYSLTALENIIDIANNAYDQRTRLQANTFLLEKVVGRNYTLIQNNNNNELSNITINLIPIGPEPEENESWGEDADSWGNEIYDPEK